MPVCFFRYYIFIYKSDIDYVGASQKFKRAIFLWKHADSFLRKGVKLNEDCSQ